MGLFDRIKKAARSAAGAVAPPQPVATPAPELAPEPVDRGPSFVWDGSSYPIPQGWSELAIDDWFLQLETLRDRMMNIQNERLPAMTDKDGNALDPEEVLLISQYGFQSGGHYEKYRTWAVYNWARQTGGNPTGCELRRGTIARARIRAAKANARSAPGGALAPVEGISCAQWAELQAKIAGGVEPTGLVAAADIDPARWARVSAEWNRRMSSDTSGTVATTYANAFAGAAVRAVGDEPVPFEMFVEVTEALRAGATRGVDATAVLASFNLRPVDWSNIGAYWSRRTAQEATKYHNLYTQLGAKYAAKYGNGDGLTNDQREEMILGKILKMAGTGQAFQILPLLRSYFPDDANDAWAMDWWLDKACDLCGASGNRGAAQQLLLIRYPLQQGEDAPMQDWVMRNMESLF